MSAKEKTMKYGLVGLFLGILLLAHLDLLAENLSYLLLGLLLLLVAYLILVKKFYFFSNLIPKNTTDIHLSIWYGFWHRQFSYRDYFNNSGTIFIEK